MKKTLFALRQEYRQGMDADVLHSWAKDVCQAIDQAKPVSRSSIPQSHSAEGKNFID